ncbi:ribosome-associated translation inhibitor RaiA, partial [Vibrio sp. 10N.222.51.C12]
MKITSKNIEITPSMVELIEEKVAHINHYFPYVESSTCHIVYHASYGEFDVDLNVHVEQQSFFVKHSSISFHSAVIESFHALEHKLEKNKTKHSIKHQNHHVHTDTDT